MHSTNYRSTLITVAEDCPVAVASPPVKAGTVAHVQYELLRGAPYAMTSDALLLETDRKRLGNIDPAEWAAKARACLRTSPLVKRHGYGLHHGADGRVALVPFGSGTYARLLADLSVVKRPGMRNRRG